MRLARFVFLRSLALVYLVAFASLAVQARGLWGEHGIQPVREYLTAAGEYIGPSTLSRVTLVPTLLWAGPSDRSLVALLWAGIGLSLLLLLDLLPAATLALLWLLYLSFVAVGQEFLSFQWDSLLLETGFLAIFLAPLRAWPRRPGGDAPPSRVVIWLFRWLTFRLMFGSGVVKLASGDPTWHDLTALDFHFETQPLPTVLGWWAHQLPSWIHSVLTAGMFAIELGVPFLILTTRRLRALAALALVSLQLFIGACGNYTFFNLLSAALCLLLIDDELWPARLRPAGDPAAAPPAGRCWPIAVTAPLAVVLGFLSLLPVASLFGVRLPLPYPAVAIYRAAAPFFLVNRYGLFSIMTTERIEIRIEGSLDGSEWREYVFRWKPGKPGRAPRWVQPHQPRLDWQMWFAALGNYRQAPWVLRLMQRLCEGEPSVVGLFEGNPFAGAPPRLVRATAWQYHMTRLGERRETGAWWKIEPRGAWSPVVGAAKAAEPAGGPP